jgi:hypothetical protein
MPKLTIGTILHCKFKDPYKIGELVGGKKYLFEVIKVAQVHDEYLITLKVVDRI